MNEGETERGSYEAAFPGCSKQSIKKRNMKSGEEGHFVIKRFDELRIIPRDRLKVSKLSALWYEKVIEKNGLL